MKRRERKSVTSQSVIKVYIKCESHSIKYKIILLSLKMCRVQCLGVGRKWSEACG